MVSTVEDPGKTTTCPKTALAPGGRFNNVKLTGSENPIKDPISTFVVTLPSLHSVTEGGFSVNVKFGSPASIVMFALLISKKNIV